ncbi:MAG: (d)CMP kinase [Micromonosporaceae bacterium]
MESGQAPFRGVVAVDGPSGSGKSTVSRRLAGQLGARYLDTGAMYRALTWAVLQASVDPHDADAVLKVMSDTRVEVVADPESPGIAVNGVAVDGPIRSLEVTGAVSTVAAVSGVRSALVAEQRRIIGGPDRPSGIVVEGRDIGAVVAPGAQLKVYLTASEGERARRRSAEHAADLQATAADLARRDKVDSTRAVSPLHQASDAVVLDTTELGIDAVVAQLRRLLRERGE